MSYSFNLNKVDLNLLKVFDLLMQERSVTRAADRANRTQSAISHSLGRLREIFGDELFVRQSGVMNPTELAKELAIVITQSLTDLQDMIDRHVTFKPLESSRKFRVGVTDFTGTLYMPALLKAFQHQAPNAKLTIVPVYLYDTAELLVNLNLDCLLIGNPISRGDQIIETVLVRHGMLCAGWQGNAHMDDLTLENYLALPHLQISPDGDERGVSDKTLGEMGLSRRVTVTIPYYMMTARVLKGTQMLAAISDGLLSLLDSRNEIRVVPLPFKLPDVRICLVYTRSRQADAGHIWLRGCIRTVVSACEKQRRTFLKTAMHHVQS